MNRVQDDTRRAGDFLGSGLSEALMNRPRLSPKVGMYSRHYSPPSPKKYVLLRWYDRSVSGLCTGSKAYTEGARD
jgi:hypothetical protein